MASPPRTAPGSFSRNLAWHGTGFKRLHDGIRSGFKNQLKPVAAAQWRRDSGIPETDLNLLPVRFFFYSKGGTLQVDEMIYRGISNPHTMGRQGVNAETATSLRRQPENSVSGSV